MSKCFLTVLVETEPDRSSFILWYFTQGKISVVGMSLSFFLHWPCWLKSNLIHEVVFLFLRSAAFLLFVVGVNVFETELY